MIKIPEKLKNEKFRFIRVASKDKVPIDEDWQNTNNFSFNDSKITEHLKHRGNYGAVSTFGDLVIVDADDPLAEEELSKLPKTLTIRTGGGGVHAYFLSDLSEKLVLRDPTRIEVSKKGKKKFKHIGEIQSGKAMVVGPGCIHETGNKYEIIKDVPITRVSKEKIIEVFGKYNSVKLKKPKVLFEDADSEIFRDPVLSTIKNKVKLVDLMKEQGYDLNKNPTECLLGHDSRRKRNFSYNKDEGLHHCFNCGEGGDIFNFVMNHENMNFVEAKEFLIKKLFGDLNNLFLGYEHIESKKRDKLFSNFKSLFRISRKGPYAPAIRALFYSLQGHALKENLIEIGTMHEDLRNSFVLSIRSGGRKQGFIDVISKTAKKMDWECSSINSLHEEQLVGKSVSRGKKAVPEVYKGYLNDDILILNDSVTLINDKKFELARNYLMQSQDTLGKNPIRKKLTEQSKENALKYRANCSCFFFIQPVPIFHENINTGWERRFPFIQIDIPDNERELAMAERFSDNYCPSWGPWIAHLKKLEKSVQIWNLTKEAQDKLTEVTKLLVNYFKEIQGVRGDKDFGENRRFKFSDDLVIYAAIFSAIEECDKIEERHVILAFKDYAPIAEASFLHFLKCVRSYSKTTKPGIQTKMIDFLRECGCVSEDSSNLTIADFKSKIASRTGISLSGINYHHKKLLGEGIISIKQIYRGETKVWLNKEAL